VKLVTGLFRRKSLDQLVGETADPSHQLRRVLGPVQLTLLGVGAIIGAGIFSTVGTAAAGGGEHVGAGPALVLSFLFVAVACGFAALCYSEFASMVPVSGSAYTYAYATLGELVAWIIGWDLILEYAVGNVAVAISWSDSSWRGRYGWARIIALPSKPPTRSLKPKPAELIWARWAMLWLAAARHGTWPRGLRPSRSSSTCRRC
jgi:amino acid transporter